MPLVLNIIIDIIIFIPVLSNNSNNEQVKEKNIFCNNIVNDCIHFKTRFNVIRSTKNLKVVTLIVGPTKLQIFNVILALLYQCHIILNDCVHFNFNCK